jgi:hypothetical protein
VFKGVYIKLGDLIAIAKSTCHDVTHDPFPLEPCQILLFICLFFLTAYTLFYASVNSKIQHPMSLQLIVISPSQLSS